MLHNYRSKIGYTLSSEEHSPLDLVKYAKMAEEAGFEYGFISDHFHPWVNAQGQSPFVWGAIGGISTVTKKFVLGTGVTCPIMRIHPVIIAHAAATAASMMEGRFILGLGTGENLNEHVIADGWPMIDVRRDMLAEAIEIIKLLWQGGTKSYFGNYYNVEQARIYTLPENLPEIFIAASGEKSAKLAGELGDGLISTSPDEIVVKAFEDAGGKDKPKYAQFTVSYDEDEEKAIETAYTIWPNAGLRGQLSQEIKTPDLFESATAALKKEDIKTSVVYGSDITKHTEKIDQYMDAGFDYVYAHQVGNKQKEFIDFYSRNILDKY